VARYGNRYGRGYGGWAPYVPVAQRRRQAALKMDALRKKGVDIQPVTIDGRKIARWDTLLVNRLLTDWIAPASRDVRPPEVLLVPEADGTGLAKDVTS